MLPTKLVLSLSQACPKLLLCFFCPPIGVIDGSVLTAVGLLLMFGVVAQIPTVLTAVKNGKTIKLQKGDFSAEVSASDE